MPARTDAEIVAELKRRKSSGTLSANERLPQQRWDTTPLSDNAIDGAESRLGFKIPLLLRSVYRDVSNGGFGESYGLLGLVGGPLNEDGMDSVSLYINYKKPQSSDEFWAWPSGLLPICQLGCAMFHCVDCNSPMFPIIWFEPNPHEDGQTWEDSFIPFCKSLNEYLSAWIDGIDLWSKLGDA